MARIKSVLKQRAGFTLIELCVTIGLMAMVVWIAGGAVYMAGDSYALTTRMQDDEYAARTAMLSISRELHRGWRGVAYLPPEPRYDDPASPGVITGYDPARLKLWMEAPDNIASPGDLEYTFDKQVYGAGTLKQAINAGTTPVQFEEMPLRDFVIEADIIVDDGAGGYTGEIATKGSFTGNLEHGIPKLKITLVCEHGLTVSTKVALLRIPPTSPASPGTG
jgi:type II secretory pathway pseudopilin PulG